MKSIIAAALSVFLCAPTNGQDTRICDNPPIPIRYREPAVAPITVTRVTPRELFQRCGAITELACAFPDRAEVVILDFDGLKKKGLTIADAWCLLQHERAHLRGWGAGHEP